MRRLALLTLSLLVAAGTRCMADPWLPGGECRPEDQAKYDQFERAVRTASPGSTVYVPKPYPRTDPQVIQDFLYQYASLHREGADPSKLPKGELPLLRGILDSTVTFTVQKAEDWTPERCGKEERSYFFYLIRVFDAASGAELSRVTLRESGLWTSKSNYFRGAPFSPLPDAKAAMRRIAAAYNIEGDAPRYVVTLGSIYCPWSAPCLAFRHGADAYIYQDSPLSKVTNGLFKIAGTEPRFVLKPGEHIGAANVMGSMSMGTDGTAQPFYVAGTTWTIARKVIAPAAR